MWSRNQSLATRCVNLSPLSSSKVKTCLCSAFQTVTTTLCLLQQTPVCTHIMCSTHWIMTTAGCSVLRYDFLFVQRHKCYFNFRSFVRNEVVFFSLYVKFLDFRKLLRRFKLNMVLRWGGFTDTFWKNLLCILHGDQIEFNAVFIFENDPWYKKLE